MKKMTYILCGIVSLVSISVCAMEKVIFSSDQTGKKIADYTLKCDRGREILYLPQTLSPDWSKCVIKNYSYPSQRNTSGQHNNTNEVWPAAQLWVSQKIHPSSTGCKKVDVYRLFEKGKKATAEKSYDLPLNSVKRTILYDGINKRGIAVLGTMVHYAAEKIEYNLFLIKQQSSGSAIIPFLTSAGTLHTLTLEDNTNSILTSVTLLIGEESRNFLFKTVLTENNRGGYRGECISEIVTPIPLQEIISVGSNNYLGIGNNHNLYRIECDQENKLVSCDLQNTRQFPENSLFHHIAFQRVRGNADNTFKKIALLAKHGTLYTGKLEEEELAVCSSVATIENSENVSNVYYKDGNISLVYKDNTIVVYQENV